MFTPNIINRVVAERPNLAMRIVEKIKTFIKVFKMSKIEKAQYKMLLQAENLYLRSAIEHKRAKIEELIDKAREERSIDQQEQVGYNKNTQVAYSKKGGYYSQFETIVMQWAFSDKRNVGDFTVLYNAENNTWNKLIADNSESRYHIDIAIEDMPDNIKIIKDLYGGAYNENNKGERGTSSLVRSNIEGYESVTKHRNDDNISVEKRITNGQTSGVYQGEYQRNGRGNTRQGNRNKRAVDYHFNDDGSQEITYSDGTSEIRYSLKDSLGNELSKEQAEFFKDSKVRDDNGNLLVVYHGTNNEFFTFDKDRVGKGIDQFGAGYYFTTEKDGATRYGDRVINSYLNIVNPFEINMTKSGGGLDQFYSYDLTPSQAYEILKMHPDIMDAEDSPLGNYSERFWEDGVTESVIREVAEQMTQIGNFADNSMFGYYPNELNNAIKKVLGYDGIQVNLGNNEKYYIAWQPNQIKLTTNLNPTSDQDIRYSKKITKGMSDLERYNVLKDRVIENIPTAKQLRNEDINNIAILKGGEKKKLVKKIVSEFGVFDKQYYNADIELDFNYSRNNLKESYIKQKKNYLTFTKMFSVFDEIIDNAIGIEVHNRNDVGYKYDKTLKQVYVLVSAFNDSENIVPVKLEIKEFADKENSLYVAVALEDIKREGVLKLRGTNGVAQNSRPSNISIAELFRNINPNDKNFTKYIPKQFLESEIEYSKKPSARGDYVKARGNLETDKVYTKAEAEAIEKKVSLRIYSTYLLTTTIFASTI